MSGSEKFGPEHADAELYSGSVCFVEAMNGHAPDAHSSDPMMHKTATVDYIIVLKGEIYAIMDQGEVKLKAGDVLVQRGTNHSWSVRGKKPCIIAAVLVSAKRVKAPARKALARRAKALARRRKGP